MPVSSFALIIVSVTISAAAQIAFKFGVISDVGGRLGPFSKLLTPGVLLGLSLYAIGTLIWLTALERVELSQAYPFVGLGFAITTFAGWWIFGDNISVQRLAGVMLIVGGIVTLARSG
jgi:multidrug transporter EmrE-like cation transporter